MFCLLIVNLPNLSYFEISDSGNMSWNYNLKLKRQRHSKDQLEEAVCAVISDGATVRSVAERYRIKMSTFSGHVKPPKTGDERKAGPGRKAALPESVEAYLVEGIITAAQLGWPLNRRDIKSAVTNYCMKMNIMPH